MNTQPAPLAEERHLPEIDAVRDSADRSQEAKFQEFCEKGRGAKHGRNNQKRQDAGLHELPEAGKERSGTPEADGAAPAQQAEERTTLDSATESLDSSNLYSST